MPIFSESSVVVTMPGKIGDLIWSLPTVREISKKHGQPVDMYTMPHFESICPLVERQPYINTCGSIDGWEVDGNQALQEWMPPSLPKQYEYVYNLGYRHYPNYPLILESALLLPIELQQPVLPFLEVDGKDGVDIVFGFSVYVQPIMQEFISAITSKVIDAGIPDLTWTDGSILPWKEFAEAVNAAKVFIGDKSGMHVIAHGLNKQFIIEAEGNSQRRNPIFCCPYNEQNVFRIESSEHYSIMDHIDIYAAQIIEYLKRIK